MQRDVHSRTSILFAMINSYNNNYSSTLGVLHDLIVPDNGRDMALSNNDNNLKEITYHS